MDQQLLAMMDQVEAKHWWFAGRRAVVAAVIRRQFPDYRSRRIDILDAGCGTGGNLSLLGGFGTVAGVEPNDEARRCASQKSCAAVVSGMLPDNLPFSAGSFDLVVLLDVLEHIDDDLSALKALRRVLRPGGSVLLTVPAFPSLWSGHDEANHHRRRYRRRDVIALLEAGGFFVDFVSFFNTFLFPPAAVVRLVGRFNPKSATGRDNLVLPNPILNAVLSAVFSSESRLLGRVRLPFGLSILAVAGMAAGRDRTPSQ